MELSQKLIFPFTKVQDSKEDLQQSSNFSPKKATPLFILFALKEIPDIHKDIVQVIASFIPTKTLQWDSENYRALSQRKYTLTNNNLTCENIGSWMNRSMVKESINNPEIIEVE